MLAIYYQARSVAHGHYDSRRGLLWCPCVSNAHVLLMEVATAGCPKSHRGMSPSVHTDYWCHAGLEVVPSRVGVRQGWRRRKKEGECKRRENMRNENRKEWTMKEQEKEGEKLKLEGEGKAGGRGILRKEGSGTLWTNQWVSWRLGKACATGMRA